VRLSCGGHSPPVFISGQVPSLGLVAPVQWRTWMAISNVKLF